MIRTKKSKAVYIFYIIFFASFLLLGVYGYQCFFSSRAVIEQYLINQFNYNADSIEEMQTRREKFLEEVLILESQENGIVKEKREYAVNNGEHCSLLNMKVEKKESGVYEFEVWYGLSYDVAEIEDKRMHMSGIMGMKSSGLISKKIAIIEVNHACEEIVEKE